MKFNTMNKYTFSTQKGKAYYCNSIPGFIKDRSDNIVGQLVRESFQINKEQSDAWENQISCLQDKLETHGVSGDIIFEYDIVRLGKRIDVILLIKHMVFSLEFKNGAKGFLCKDARQAEDYAIDIKNFHKESEDLYVCPILIATESKASNNQDIGSYPDKQIYLQKENMETLVPKVLSLTDKYGNDEEIDFEKWFNSPYYPTPTIIEAAIEAYTTHNLTEIAKSESVDDNTRKCEDSISKIVEYAKNNKKKCVCFVTGVPGAGKTLVGLDVVSRNIGTSRSVYLSGNGPLVEVLREALLRSSREKLKQFKDDEDFNKKIKLNDASIKALIQSSFSFKKDNVSRGEPTSEHIIIFDEAQRVWNKEKMIRKHKNDPGMNVSEPELFYTIMDRHNDWAVMVCLVGLGQDIYDGEVGINGWFDCGINRFPNWELFYSNKIFYQTEDKGVDKEMILSCNRCHQIEGLHLETAIRSFRADKLNKFVDYLLNNESEKAKSVYNEISKKYPLYVTRDINKAKAWAKSKVRGSQRCGVIASSGAQRLKPEGVYVPTDIDVKNWFLAEPNDLRSSNMMEVVASEFKVQGLEIDWSVVCWDADLRRLNSKEWGYYSFRGTKWQNSKSLDKQRYLVNSYRVLLTRARQGMVIYVSPGDVTREDDTRNPEFYDGIYLYLKKCGIEDLDY